MFTVVQAQAWGHPQGNIGPPVVDFQPYIAEYSATLSWILGHSGGNTWL